jgi:Acetyltransferase (GNAT) domain/Sterol carrier protein domain
LPAGGRRVTPDVAAETAQLQLRRAEPGDEAEVLSVIGRAHELARDCGPVTHAVAVRRWLNDPDTYTYLAEDGFLAYRWSERNEEIFVERVLGASAETTRALWGVLASHASTAETVRVLIRPADPFWWLTREHDANIASGSMWMLRVVDAPAAIAARGLPLSCELTVPLRVTDDVCPVNSGGWELMVAGGKGSLSRTLRQQAAPATAAGQRDTLPAGALPAGAVSAGSGPALGAGKCEGEPAGTVFTLGARGLAALYAGVPVSTLRLAGLAMGGTADDAALDAAFAATPFMLDGF